MESSQPSSVITILHEIINKRLPFQHTCHEIYIQLLKCTEPIWIDIPEKLRMSIFTTLAHVNVCPFISKESIDESAHHVENTSTDSNQVYYYQNKYYASRNYIRKPSLEVFMQLAMTGKNVPSPTEPYKLWMKEQFHRAPPMDFLTEKRWKIIQHVFPISNKPTNLLELQVLIQTLKETLGNPEFQGLKVDRKRNHERKTKKGLFEGYSSHNLPDKKNTLKAYHKRISENQRKKTLPSHLHSWNIYDSAMNVLDILVGRLQNFTPAAVRTDAAVWDKKGLLEKLATPEILSKDLLTSIFVTLQACELSRRKEFTLEKQQQGGLNEHTAFLFKLLQEHKTTNWDFITLVYPIGYVMDRTSLQWTERMLCEWKLVFNELIPFMKCIWESGAKECSARNMMVPKKGKGVNSTGWNAAVGAWNNAVRQYRACCKHLNTKPLPVFKCLKLTAGDQMQWAENEGKGVHEDAEVFKWLCSIGLYPWTVFEQDDHEKIRSIIIDGCKRVNVELIPHWLGDPKGWTTPTKQDLNMICGVVVNCDRTMSDLLKQIGIFGSNPAHTENLNSFINKSN
jgi:hypothetical protein